MRPERLLAWAALLSLAAAAQAGTDCPDSGRKLYFACSSCHWETGEGSEAFGAPALAGLPEAYLVRQVEHFKSGLRGTDAHDASGRQMALLAKTLRDEESVRAVSCYIATLPPVPPAPVLKGNARRGRQVFTTCAACHGDRAQGNPALGAPPLVQQADWYLHRQLQAFHAGWRGTHPDDTFGQQMRAVAATLPDQSALLDVVAYITSLR
jgi:cytochrome c553